MISTTKIMSYTCHFYPDTAPMHYYSIKKLQFGLLTPPRPQPAIYSSGDAFCLATIGSLSVYIIAYALICNFTFLLLISMWSPASPKAKLQWLQKESDDILLQEERLKRQLQENAEKKQVVQCSSLRSQLIIIGYLCIFSEF